MDTVKLNAALSTIRGLRNRITEVAIEHEKEIDENIRRLDDLKISDVANLENTLAAMSAATASNDSEITLLLDALSELSNYAHNDQSIVRASEISSSLTLDDARSVASSRAAKLLKDITNAIDARLEAVELLLQSDQTSLDTLQEIVNYITINRSTLEALSIASIAGLQAALDLKANASDVPPNATPAADGFMSKEDKGKLDGIEDGAQVNPTELTYTQIVDAVSAYFSGDTGAFLALDALDTVPKASALAEHILNPNHDDSYMLKENDMLVRTGDKTFAGISTPLVYEAFDTAVLGNIFLQLGHAYAQSTVQIRMKITSNSADVNNFIEAVIWGRMNSSAWVSYFVDVIGGGHGDDTGSKIKVGFGSLGGLPTIWVGYADGFEGGNPDANWGTMFRAEVTEMMVMSPTGNADLFLYDAVLGVTSVAPVTTGVFTTATWTNALLASGSNPGMMSSADYNKLLALTPSASATDTVSGRLYARGNESLGIWGANARLNRIMRYNDISSGATPVVVLAPVYNATLLYKKGFIGRVRVQGGTNTASQFDATIDVNVVTGGSSAILEATTVPSSSGTWAIVKATVSGVQHYCLALTNTAGTAYATVTQNVSVFLEGMAVNTVVSGIDWNLPNISSPTTYVSLSKLVPVALNSSHIAKTINANVVSTSDALVPSEKAVRTELDKKIEGTSVTTVRASASASDTSFPTEKAVRTQLDALTNSAVPLYKHNRVYEASTIESIKTQVSPGVSTGSRRISATHIPVISDFAFSIGYMPSVTTCAIYGTSTRANMGINYADVIMLADCASDSKHFFLTITGDSVTAYIGTIVGDIFSGPTIQISDRIIAYSSGTMYNSLSVDINGNIIASTGRYHWNVKYDGAAFTQKTLASGINNHITPNGVFYKTCASPETNISVAYLTDTAAETFSVKVSLDGLSTIARTLSVSITGFSQVYPRYAVWVGELGYGYIFLDAYTSKKGTIFYTDEACTTLNVRGITTEEGRALAVRMVPNTKILFGLGMSTIYYSKNSKIIYLADLGVVWRFCVVDKKWIEPLINSFSGWQGSSSANDAIIYGNLISIKNGYVGCSARADDLDSVVPYLQGTVAKLPSL